MPEQEKLDVGIDFQRLLVKLMLTQPDWLIVNHGFIVSSNFDNIELQSIVRIAADFYNEHEVPPDPSVMKELLNKKLNGEMRRMVVDEFNAIGRVQITPARVQYATSALVEFATRQTYREAIIKAADSLQSGRLSEIRGIFDSALSFTENGMDSEIFYFADDAIQSRASYSAESDKVPTLYKTIDERTHGGPSKKELWVVMAPTNRGKSIAMVNIGTNALFVGKNVGHVTNEMSGKKVSFRYDMRLTGMTRQEIEADPGRFKELMSKFRGLYKGNLIIKEYPARSASVADISAWIKTLARRHGIKLDILIVDLLDELKRPRMEKDHLAIGNVTADLHALTKRSNLLTWATTQTNRGAFSKVKFDLDDVGDSWEKVKIADGVIGMCQTEDEYEQNTMRWYQLKDRDNKKFFKPVMITTKFEHMLMKEM